MPCFDNLDKLEAWQSDNLCSAATGAAVIRRRRYTDKDTIIQKIHRCICLNGINMVAERPDLLDRSIIFELKRIGEAQRRDETEFWAEFEEARPEILYGMFEALSGAIRVFPEVKIDKLPRMADFAKWGFAIAEAMGIGGDVFLKAFNNSLGSTNETTVLNDRVGEVVVAFMANIRKWVPHYIDESNKNWEGTATELYKVLTMIANAMEISTRINHWPADASSISKHLNKIKHNLDKFGIVFEHERQNNKARTRIIRLLTKDLSNTVVSEPSNESVLNSNQVDVQEADFTNQEPYDDSLNTDALQSPSRFCGLSRERLLEMLDGTDGLDSCDNIPIGSL